MKFLLLIVFSIALSGCAKNNDGTQSWDGVLKDLFPSVGPYIAPLVIEEPTALISEIEETSEVKCEKDEDCFEGVGMLLQLVPKIVDEDRVKRKKFSPVRCTGFLIAPDLFITNSHCITDEVKQNPDLCSTRTWVVFNQSEGQPSERVRCETLITYSNVENQRQSVDYALIKLKRSVERKPISLSSAGIENGNEVTAVKITPEDGYLLRGKIEVDHCKSVYNTSIFPSINHAFSQLMTFKGCSAMPGNSGAPILNSEGKAVAILQGSEEISPANEANGSDGKRFVQIIEIGTNTACIPNPTTGNNPVPTECSR